LSNWSPTLIHRVSRRGKYILLETEAGATMVHLGMSGSLRVAGRNELVQKHDHVDFEFGQHVLRFNDPRRFGSVLWTTDWQNHDLIKKLGPEPLSETFDLDYFYTKSKDRKISVKQFVMDSHVVVGVGNIYANEALFLSGIHPARAAGRISKARYANLLENIKKVLAAAIEQGGTTLKDFVGGDGKPGYFQQKLYVYGRAGQACKACGGELKEMRQNGRSTVFCGVCQR